jgi:hypothetical protein
MMPTTILATAIALDDDPEFLELPDFSCAILVFVTAA